MRARGPVKNLIVAPVPIMPTVKQTADMRDDLWMFISTILPANAADIPRKKIAKLNAQPTENVLMPIAFAIDSLKVLQQYTVPIEQCINKAGIAALVHLFIAFTSQKVCQDRV